jgi:hypothetical protein
MQREVRHTDFHKSQRINSGIKNIQKRTRKINVNINHPLFIKQRM